jgi:hypothetical protein
MAEGVLYVKAKVSTSAILGERRANVARVTEGLIFDTISIGIPDLDACVAA